MMKPKRILTGNGDGQIDSAWPARSGRRVPGVHQISTSATSRLGPRLEKKKKRSVDRGHEELAVLLEIGGDDHMGWTQP